MHFILLKFSLSKWFRTLPANYICVMGMLEDVGGHTDVTFCPQSTIHLQSAVVLASLIHSLMNAGW